MTATLVGIVINRMTHEIAETIFPDYDAQLDHPSWTARWHEPMEMVKLLAEEYEMVRHDPMLLDAMIEARR